MLVLCGWDRGDTAATWMGEANLLGLVAAVALPLAYAQAVAAGLSVCAGSPGGCCGLFRGRRAAGCSARPGSRSAAQPSGDCDSGRVGSGGRIADPPASRRRSTPSPSRAWVFRSVIPTLYVLAAAAAQTVAGPSRAGLVTTFPSMSLVVLAVTHLEAGPSEASRIARFLPFGNLSTLAFLAAFCWVCPAIGLGGGLVAGYVAAVLMLVLIEQGISRVRFPRGAALPVARPISALRPSGTAWGFATYPALSATRLYAHTRLAPGRLGRGRLHLAHRGGFSPWVETLGW